jgi:hypothetical protein
MMNGQPLHKERAMRRGIWSLSLFSLCGIGFAASVTEQATAAPAAIVKSRFVQIAPNKTGCEFAEDALTLVVFDGGKQLGKQDFCSGYGRASAKTFADKHGHTYVLLDYRDEFHGTPDDSTGYLAVYRLPLGEMPEIVRVPVSWLVGGLPTGCRFAYHYDLRPNRSGSLQIRLRRSADCRSEVGVPSEKTIVIDTLR